MPRKRSREEPGRKTCSRTSDGEVSSREDRQGAVNVVVFTSALFGFRDAPGTSGASDVSRYRHVSDTCLQGNRSKNISLNNLQTVGIDHIALYHDDRDHESFTKRPLPVGNGPEKRSPTMAAMLGGGDGALGQLPLEQWFFEMPVCTRWWTTATVITGVLVQCHILTPFQLFYSYRAVFHKSQVGTSRTMACKGV